MKATTIVMAVLAMTTVLVSPSAAQVDNRATVAAGLSWLVDEGETAAGVTFDAHVPFRTADAMTLGVVGDVSFHKLSDEWVKELAGGVRVSRRLERITPFAQFVVGVDSSFGSSDPIFGPAFGADVAVGERLNIRGQIDLRWLRFAGHNDAFSRVWVGLAFPFGN